jgi:NAD(P)-dependent dehydrogenase (short-subunit alcohol dehydrogenase family)
MSTFIEPRNVLVTGGSSGIGRATVNRFARAGDRVWFTYRHGRARAEAVVSELCHDGYREVAAFELSQGDWHSHERLVANLPGPVDVLVNNAAVGSKTVGRYSQDAGHRQDEVFFQVNSVGPLWLVRQLLPGMIDRGYGKIINIASVGGGVAQFPAFHVADGMSKAALAYLTRHLAAELVHAPVEVFALCPGAVDTAMLEASTLAALTPAERYALEDRLPKGRLLQPEEIANLVWWLCGDDACALHGAVIDASMGLGVHPGLLTGAQSAQHGRHEAAAGVG